MATNEPLSRLCLTLWLFFAGQIFAQSDPAFTLSGAVAHPLTVSAAELAQMPHVQVKVKEHDTEMIYDGVLIYKLLQKAGAPVDKELSGRALATYVLATGKDGYQVVFSITEFDPTFSDSPIIVADKANGKALPDSQGPFKIVVPHDKRPARGLRMMQKIEVVRLRP